MLCVDNATFWDVLCVVVWGTAGALLLGIHGMLSVEWWRWHRDASAKVVVGGDGAEPLRIHHGGFVPCVSDLGTMGSQFAE